MKTGNHLEIPYLSVHPLRDDYGVYAIRSYHGTRIG